VKRVTWQTGDVQMIGTGNTGVDGGARTLEFELHNDGTPQLDYAGWGGDTAKDEAYPLDEGDEYDEGTPAIEFLSQLLNLHPVSTRDSFAPRDRLSKWNQWNGTYEPLLDSNREVILRVSDDGGVTWRTEFHGYLGS